MVQPFALRKDLFSNEAIEPDILRSLRGHRAEVCDDAGGQLLDYIHGQLGLVQDVNEQRRGISVNRGRMDSFVNPRELGAMTGKPKQCEIPADGFFAVSMKKFATDASLTGARNLANK